MADTFTGGAIGLDDEQDAAGRPPFPFRFDHTSPEAVEAARRATAHLVTRVSAETKAALRALISKGITDGIHPRKLTRLISDSIGLNAPQAVALANYRLRLEAEGALTAATLDKAVSKYGARLLAQRKLMIARTETMRALNLGKIEAGQQAIRDGWLDPGVGKRWTAAPEELEPPRCDECADLDGEVVPLDARFSSGDVGPPAHPYCRCSLDILPADTWDVTEPPEDPEIRETMSPWSRLVRYIGRLFGGKDFA